MSDALRSLALSDSQYRLVSEMLRRRCGLHFDERTRFLLEKHLARRIADSESSSAAAYLHRLRAGPQAEEEFWRLIDVLTTNETYFFRERAQLDTLVAEIIPELRRGTRASARPVSIWSAGCASGEEPYSIVMLGLEAGLVPGRDFRVYASDISRAVLAKARRGVYREASFRETEEVLRRRYFEARDGLERISEAVKGHVDFIHMNLLDDVKVSLLGVVDVIVCRNVIIYFDVETRRNVVRTFHDRLRPGGYLLLGHSESLIHVTSDFELRPLERELVYRRPVPGEEPDGSWPGSGRRGRAAADASAGDR